MSKVKEVYVDDYNVSELLQMITEGKMRYIGGNFYIQPHNNDTTYRLTLEEVPATKEEFLQMNEGTF